MVGGGWEAGGGVDAMGHGGRQVEGEWGGGVWVVQVGYDYIGAAQMARDAGGVVAVREEAMSWRSKAAKFLRRRAAPPDDDQGDDRPSRNKTARRPFAFSCGWTTPCGCT